MQLKIFQHKKTLEKCHIYQMLKAQAKKRHISFHTPGHKTSGFDITELAYSDNLASPHGCIALAEADIAQILGAKNSFIVTDGSTCGVLSILYAGKLLGVKKIAVCATSHKSVFNGCAILGITPIVFTQNADASCPARIDEIDFLNALNKADALFLTSPNYYGRIPSLQKIYDECKKQNKFLFIDGAHGGHLHFEKNLYAGNYADMWVDGVHKSLPALTQGAIVCAKTNETAKALRVAVNAFRTTSPSYPIMASVEYAVKYPQNLTIKREVEAFAKTDNRIRVYEDYTKLCVLFGKNVFKAKQALEKKGIFAEFCDGNLLMFYLSPLTKNRAFSTLKKHLRLLLQKYPYENVDRVPAPLILQKEGDVKEVLLSDALGKISAENCGLFPPCIPLIFKGERIEKEKLALLERADNAFGVYENKILVFKENKDE